MKHSPHKMNMSALFKAILVALLFVSDVNAQQSIAITYNITLTSPEQHLVEVQLVLPEGPDQRELQLPVWNALYQIRDFAQYVNWVRAKDRAGRTIAVRELDKSRWQISGTAHGALVEYQMFAD